MRSRIAGYGIISCYGSGTEPLVEALSTGHSGERRLSQFPLEGSNDYWVNEVDRTGIPTGRAGDVELFARAIEQALDHAGLDTAGEGCALLIGTSGFLFTAEDEYRALYPQDPNHTPRTAGYAGEITGPLTERFGLSGPVINIHTACSSSANALLMAHEMLQRGECARAIVVGAEGLSAIALSGFYSLMLLDADGCQPFDAERDGLQIGEAFAAVVLEPEAGQEAASGNAWVCGGDNLCDTHHITSASPDGSSMRKVIEGALANAGTQPADIAFIKAHGTGSLDNDAGEATAMKAVFGDALPPFTVIKRYLGHTLGACGVVETVALSACIRAGFVPATAGFRQVDDEIGIAPLTENATAQPGRYLSNFFGFGGNYAALVTEHD